MTTSFAECHNHSVKLSLPKPQEGWVCTIWELRVSNVVVELEVYAWLFMLKEFFFSRSMKSLWYEKASSISAFFISKHKETRETFCIHLPTYIVIVLEWTWKLE